MAGTTTHTVTATATAMRTEHVQCPPLMPVGGGDWLCVSQAYLVQRSMWSRVHASACTAYLVLYFCMSMHQLAGLCSPHSAARCASRHCPS